MVVATISGVFGSSLPFLKFPFSAALGMGMDGGRSEAVAVKPTTAARYSAGLDGAMAVASALPTAEPTTSPPLSYGLL